MFRGARSHATKIQIFFPLISVFTSLFAAADIQYAGNDPNNYFIFPGRYGEDNDAESLILKLGEAQTFTWVTNYTSPLDIYLQQLDNPDGTAQLLKGSFTGRSLPWDGNIVANISLSRVFSLDMKIPDNPDRVLFTSRRMNMTGSGTPSSTSSSVSASATLPPTSTSTSPSSHTAAPLSATTTSSSTPLPRVSSSPISVGAGIGIGIGLAAVVAILVAAAVFFFRRRSHRRAAGVGEASTGNTLNSEKDHAAGVPFLGKRGMSRRGELDGQGIQEIDGQARGELDGRDLERRTLHELGDERPR